MKVIVGKPEEYRWNKIGYHVQMDNLGKFLFVDLDLDSFGVIDVDQRLLEYRKSFYETGAVNNKKGKKITLGVIEKERKKDFKISRTD